MICHPEDTNSICRQIHRYSDGMAAFGKFFLEPRPPALPNPSISPLFEPTLQSTQLRLSSRFEWCFMWLPLCVPAINLSQPKGYQIYSTSTPLTLVPLRCPPRHRAADILRKWRIEHQFVPRWFHKRSWRPKLGPIKKQGGYRPGRAVEGGGGCRRKPTSGIAAASLW